MGDVVRLADASRPAAGDASAARSTDDASEREPCYDCDCCALWTGALEQLRAAIAGHNARTPRGYPCTDGCLVCEVSEWSR